MSFSIYSSSLEADEYLMRIKTALDKKMSIEDRGYLPPNVKSILTLDKNSADLNVEYVYSFFNVEVAAETMVEINITKKEILAMRNSPSANLKELANYINKAKKQKLIENFLD